MDETSKDVKQWFQQAIRRLWPVAEGSLSFRKCPCIRKNCRVCASGEGHRSYVLYGRRGKERISIYVPVDVVPEVKRALKNGRELNIGEGAQALNIVFAAAQKLAATSAVQRVLKEAMLRASDDTFALRLLEYTENRDRNKILLDFKNVDVQDLMAAFMERMRSHYGPSVPIENVIIERGDWRAFQRWVKNSTEDMAIEQDFWRRYIGQSRKRLAQSINFLYPSGYTWSEDPRPIISNLFPVDEMGRLLETLADEQLDDTEEKAIVRFRELLEGKWYDITRRLSQD